MIDKNPELTIVMPAYNEAECIESVLNAWFAAIKKVTQNFRFIIVNDGSKDNTGEILLSIAKSESRLIVVNQKNQGHGASLLNGYHRAVDLNSDWVFQIDSDDQFEASDFAQFWTLREKSFFMLGHRVHREDAFHRLVITRILRVFLFVSFGVGISDSNIPFRLVAGHYLKRLLECIPKGTQTPNIMLAILASRDGQNLMHLPVQHRERNTGTVSIVRWKLIRFCLETSKQLLKFRLSLLGGYSLQSKRHSA